MAPKSRTNRGKKTVTKTPEATSNVGETLQGNLLLAMQDVMAAIKQHREEMATMKNMDFGRQIETTIPLEPVEPQGEATPQSIRTESSQEMSRPSFTKRLTSFKKFAPPVFTEEKTPAEAEEWLNTLEGILETMKTDEEDKVPFVEFLLQGEAREWWKMEKANFKGTNLTWKDFRDIFLSSYFSTSVCEQKEQEFLYLKQGNMTVMQYNREFRKLARFAPGLVTSEKDRVRRFFTGLKPIMRKDLSTLNFSTHTELLDKALKLEKEYNQLQAYHHHGEKKRPYPEN